jgi:hypothetical protein
MRTPTATLSDTAAHRVEHFHQQAQAVRQRATVAIGATVAQRRQELVQQVAVRGMQLDQLEAEALGTHRTGGEGGDDLGDAGLVQFLRRRVGGMERQRRRRHGGPATRIIGRQLATAVPRAVHRGLATGMAELDAQRHRRPAADAGQYLCQRGLGAVIPQPRSAQLMRPRGSTAVASRISRPAPDCARLPRCMACQSLARPSSAEYWHIGAMTMRLDRVRGRTRSAKTAGSRR